MNPLVAFLNTSFVYNIGPTCVGKGFTLKLLDRSITPLKRLGLNVGTISFGQIIRDLLKRDRKFRDLHEETIRRGDLLDDPTAIQLFDGKLAELANEGPYDILFVDGFGRTVPQVHHAASLGLLRSMDHVFVIEASIQVCAERFTHRNENDGSRLEREMPTFQKRYHIHADNVGTLKKVLGATEAGKNIREIDANKSIPEFAFPAYIGHCIPLFAEKLTRKTKELQLSASQS